jgi:hypothetical protein
MDKVFEIASIPTIAHWFFVGIIVLMLCIAGAFSWTWFKGAQASVSVSFSGLHIDLPFYGRVVPLSHIVVSNARIVDLQSDTSLRPSKRTNGIGLPGYQVGWFRLMSGEKALLALSTRDRVLYVPTTQGYAVLLTAQDPDELLNALHDYSDN